MVFNKEEFARLLELARDGRSLNQLSKAADVSSYDISRALRKLMFEASLDFVIKIAKIARNNVTLDELMIAAGLSSTVKEVAI